MKSERGPACRETEYADLDQQAHESGSEVVGADDASKFVADKRMFEISGHGELGHDCDLWRVTVGATGHSHSDIRLRGR